MSRNEWEDWLIYGGEMPSVTKDWPEVKPPHDLYICGYCGKPYPPNDNPFTCSERCDYLLSEAVDEARGK